MLLRDDDFELEFGSFGTGRDIPVTFGFRSGADAMARLALPAADARYADARNAMFSEARFAAQMGRGLSYSRRRDFYARGRRYYGDTISYRTVLAAVNDGLDAGLLVERRAPPGAHRRRHRRRSCIQATPVLCQLLDRAPVRSCLRCGTEANWSPTRTHPKLARCAVKLKQSIAACQSSPWTWRVQTSGKKASIGSWAEPILPRHHQACVGFSVVALDKGGRLYGWWQGLPSCYRTALTIDGQPVREPDFGQFHAAIIYGLRGIRLIGDAYDTAEFSRAQGKLAFNIALNARNERGAVAAIAHHLKLDRSRASLLLKAVKRKHEPVGAPRQGKAPGDAAISRAVALSGGSASPMAPGHF